MFSRIGTQSVLFKYLNSLKGEKVFMTLIYLLSPMGIASICVSKAHA